MARSGASLADIEDVYTRRGRDFYRVALARTRNASLAQEVVQEGFARAIRARGGFRATGSLEAWIGRCVLNAAADALARERRTGDTADAFVGSFDDEPPDVDVRRALCELPPRQRDALFLRFYLDFDYGTIADTLGIEVGTVSATLHAARNALARALQEVPR